MADVASAKEAKFIEVQEKKAEEKKAEDLKKEEKAKEAGETKKLEAKKDEKKGEIKKESPKTDAKKDEEKKEEPKKREIILERICTVPFMHLYSKPMMKRGNAAIKFLKNYLSRHMKTDVKKVKISLFLNNAIRKRGSGRPLKKVKIKATKDKEGGVLAEIAP
ncbi:MAG: hypothetical protein V1835_01955 [Candidatus Micrarchaeota archaeon]